MIVALQFLGLEVAALAVAVFLFGLAEIAVIWFLTWWMDRHR